MEGANKDKTISYKKRVRGKGKGVQVIVNTQDTVVNCEQALTF